MASGLFFWGIQMQRIFFAFSSPAQILFRVIQSRTLSGFIRLNWESFPWVYNDIVAARKKLGSNLKDWSVTKHWSLSLYKFSFKSMSATDFSRNSPFDEMSFSQEKRYFMKWWRGWQRSRRWTRRGNDITKCSDIQSCRNLKGFLSRNPKIYAAVPITVESTKLKCKRYCFFILYEVIHRQNINAFLSFRKKALFRKAAGRLPSIHRI